MNRSSFDRTILEAAAPPSPPARVDEHITAAGWRIVLHVSRGGTLEFYDFVIFGVFARDIAQAVFPATRRWCR